MLSINYVQNEVALKLPTLARWLIVLSLLSLMIHVPFLNAACWVAGFFMLLSKNGIKNWSMIVKDKVVLAGLCLIFIFTMSLCYSDASSHIALRCWNKYLKIFYLLFFLPLFLEKKWRMMAIHSLIASVMLSEFFSYLHFFSILKLGYSPAKHWLFVQDLDASFIVSFVCYLLANLAWENRKYRGYYLGCLAVCSFNILFLNVERTGYVIYLGLASLFLLQHFKWKGLLSAFLAVPLTLSVLYFSSNPFHERVNQVASNLSEYHHGHQVTSIGLRLLFAKYSLKIVEDHMVQGVGVGSFEESYRALQGPKMIDGTWPAHPHDEYINILLQTGIVGLITYLLWIGLQIHVSFSLPKLEKNLLQGLILGFGLLGFCNASLMVNPAGACYLLFLAVFLASKYERTLSCV